MLDRIRAAGPRTLLPALLLGYVVVWTLYSVLSRSNLDINSDMVENYSWSRELQAGYFKHPPLFAWVVAAWFQIFPTADWAYYLLSFANVALAFGGIWMLIGLYDRSPRRLAAMLALGLTPFYTFSAIKFNANTMLLSVWPWLAFATIVAVRDRSLLYSALAGVLAAAAMLSKYVSAVILLTLFAGSFLIPGWRAFYASRAFPVMLVAFAVAIGPHLWWLHQTGYTTFKYVDTNKADSFGRLVRATFNFVVAQLLWLLPMFGALYVTVRGFPAALASAFNVRAANNVHRFWLVLLLGPFVLTLLFAWATFTRLSAPWGIPLWFAASTVLLYAPTVEEGDIDLRRLGLIVATVMAVGLLIAPIIRAADYWTGNAMALEPRREAAELLQDIWRKRTSKPLVNVAGSQSYASSVTFYAADHPSELVEYEPRYAPWMTPERLRTGGIAFVCAAADKACFTAADKFTARHAERVTTTLSKTYLGWRGPAHTLTFIIQPPQS